MTQEVERVPNIDAFMDALKASAAGWPMTVGWIDCLSKGESLGRGVLIKGRWAEREEAKPTFPSLGGQLPVPFMFPNGVLGLPTVKAFNAVYYRLPVRTRQWSTRCRFFYPLDVARDMAPHVRPARVHAVPVRAPVGWRPRGGATLHGGRHARRRRLLPVRDSGGLRRRGRGVPPFRSPAPPSRSISPCVTTQRHWSTR